MRRLTSPISESRLLRKWRVNAVRDAAGEHLSVLEPKIAQKQRWKQALTSIPESSTNRMHEASLKSTKNECPFRILRPPSSSQITSRKAIPQCRQFPLKPIAWLISR